MFSFNTQSDADAFKSLSSLVKTNNGQYKSVKQAQFLDKVCRRARQGYDTPESVMNFYGIPMGADQYIVQTSAMTRWADYGSRSARPVTWIFVMDTHGVVAQYKLGYVGDMRSGTSPDPKKTQKLWERVGEAVPLEVPVAEVLPESFHIGAIGNRLELQGVIKSVIEFQRTTRFSYYDSGAGYVTKIDIDGSDVVYFGHLGAKGETVRVKATIKDHSIRDGRKQTVISRPKVLV